MPSALRNTNFHMTKTAFHNAKNAHFKAPKMRPFPRSQSIHDAVSRPLGQSVAYASQYDPSLLFPIARSHNRAALDLHAGALPFAGVDLWNAYELSWLDAKGKPRVAMATFSVPADSPNIIESKSFKLYLNSFNQTRLVNSASCAAG